MLLLYYARSIVLNFFITHIMYDELLIWNGLCPPIDYY